MRLLDLFCGAGGAAMGYYRAGFDEIIGVDINPQPHYPFEFILSDAMTFPLGGFDLIHASPPCQRYSSLHGRWKDREYPDMLGPVRAALIAANAEYVIENVEGAPMQPRAFLCGRMFGLSMYRHRLFESTFPIAQLWHPRVFHALRANGTKGTAEQRNNAPIKTVCGHNTRADVAREVMGMPWATGAEVAQAIPPAYSEYVGRCFLER